MTSITPSNERLRFAAFGIERLPNGRCRAHVSLTWRGGERYDGDSEGLTSQAGELRCAAQACVIALGRVLGEDPAFELLGVKAVKAFDETVVIVSLARAGDLGGPRLVGSCLAGEDVPRGAALAVLNATNRVLGNALHMR